MYIFKKILPIIITSSIIMCGVMLPYTFYYSDDNFGEEQVLSKEGSTGDEVRKIQLKLKELGFYTGAIDGKYGIQTAAAVRKFQQYYGLTSDGIAGDQTIAALGIYSVPSNVVYKIGSSGDMVKQIQLRLINLGLLTGPADGIYGNLTASAVRQFQRNNQITADGIVGIETLKLLGLSGEGSPPNTGSYDADIELLARIINGESRGEPYQGQVAVGAVVLNRVKHPSFPNTIAGVIYQQGAFSSLLDGEFYKPIEESCYRAARDAMNGSDPSGGAIYFYNPDKTSNRWMLARPVILRIGGHIFCS